MRLLRHQSVEDLDFAAEKTREKHGRTKRFSKLISGLPVSRPRARPVSMAAELGIPAIAVDPAVRPVPRKLQYNLRVPHGFTGKSAFHGSSGTDAPPTLGAVCTICAGHDTKG